MRIIRDPPPSYGILTRINIPEDFKLTTSDGNVVGDEVCVGDKLQLTKGVDKGEFYGDDGNDDSPSVYWVSDVEALVKNIMAYHEETKRTWSDICAKSAPSDGFVDPLSGVPVYTTSVQMMGAEAAYITGNVVCSLKGDSGLGFSSSGSYTATTPGTVNLAATYDIECMYYYYGGVKMAIRIWVTGLIFPKVLVLIWYSKFLQCFRPGRLQPL